MSSWNPDQYERFRDERRQPFFDLLALVEPRPHMRVVDLGCGTGELTRVMHDRLGADETIGVDSSETMLRKSGAFSATTLRFEQADIETFASAEPFDLVFSNAALQWADDHESLFHRLTALLAPGGQLAVQMPANHDHPSHLVAAEVARETPFAEALGGYVRTTSVLPVEQYATLLHRLGYARQQVRMQVYAHLLPTAGDVVEWVKGTLLTDYEKRMPAELFAQFLDRYRERLSEVIGTESPYFYAFKRILLWAAR